MAVSVVEILELLNRVRGEIARDDRVADAELRVLYEDESRQAGDLDIRTWSGDLIVVSWATHSTSVRVIFGTHVFESVAADDVDKVVMSLLDGTFRLERRRRFFPVRRAVIEIGAYKYMSDWRR